MAMLVITRWYVPVFVHAIYNQAQSQAQSRDVPWHRQRFCSAGLVPVQLPDEKGPREDQPRLGRP